MSATASSSSAVSAAFSALSAAISSSAGSQVPHAAGQATLALTPSSDLTLALQRFAAFLPTQAQFCLSLFFLRHVVESAHAESKESPPVSYTHLRAHET